MTTPTHSFYQFVKGNTIENNYKPQNTHLIWETAYGLYFVRADNNKILEKTTDLGVTTSTVETRPLKNISRGFHDRDNNIIFLVDCDFDDSVSYIWKINLSTDTITEIESVPGDCYDVFRYDNETYILYIGSGYALESGDINPDGDVTTEWNTTGGNHFGEIDEGSPTNTGDYVQTPAVNKTDTFTMETIDMSGYDSVIIDQIYQIKCYVAANIDNGMEISGNKTGMDAIEISGSGWLSVTWSDLSLEQADLNDLEITIESTELDFCFVYTLYCIVYFYGDITNPLIYVKNLDTETAWNNDMGALAGREWGMSQITIVGTDFHFLWQWSNESAEIWRFQTGDNSFDMLKDTGGDIPPVQQHAISYDDQNILYFVLGA